MSLRIVLPLLLALQSRLVLGEEAARYSYTREIPVAVPLASAATTRVEFSVPVVLFDRVHLALLKCSETDRRCELHKFRQSFASAAWEASSEICGFGYDVPPAWRFERLDAVVFGVDRVVVDAVFKVDSARSLRYERKLRVFDVNTCATLGDIDVQISGPDGSVAFEQILSDGRRRNVTLLSANHVVPHDDGFELDVFYEDHALCYLGFIRGSIDAYGGFERQQRCFFDYYSRIRRPLTAEEDVFIVDDQYVVQDKQANLWIGLMRDWQGTESRRLREPSFKRLHDQYRISAKYGRVTKCDLPASSGNSVVNCRVYNATHVTSEFRLPIPPSDFEMHNLPDGHLQVYARDAYDSDVYRFWNLDERGLVVGAQRTSRVEPCVGAGGTELGTFLSMDGKNVCAVHGCYGVDTRGNMEIRKHRFHVACEPMDTSTNFGVVGLQE